MARYREGHGERTRERIVAEASHMIRERGLDRASVAEVMKAAGLTVGGFYAHFDDKTELLAEAMAVAIAPSLKRFVMLAKVARETGDVGAIAERYLGDSRVAERANGCAAAALASEMHRAPAPVQAAFMAGSEEAARVIAPLVEPADADAPAWGVYAMLFGALALMRAAPDQGTREAIRTRVADDLRRLARKA